MCECGCGELRPIAKIRGDGGWHFLEVYPGCNNGCGTSWGLGATWIADVDDMLRDGWLLKDAPTIEYDQYGQWGTPILDTAKLVEAFRQEMGDVEPTDEYDHPADALHDFVERGGLRAIHSASTSRPA
jgi:hypothetical protein